MKNSLLIIALFALSACAVQPVPVLLTPAQLVTVVNKQFCPQAQIVVGSLRALVGQPADVQAALDAGAPVLAAFCAANATVDAASIQTLAETTLPALRNAVTAAVLDVDQKNSIILAIGATQIILNGIISAQVPTP